MKQAACPACGGEIVFQTSIALYAACPFCSSLVLRKDLDIEKIGEAGHLQEDGSPIRIGTRGLYRGQTFEVVGRIQLQTPHGFWNEWYLRLGLDADGWLGEAQGLYGVNFLVKPDRPVPNYGTLKPGHRIVLHNEAFFVKDMQLAHCVAGQGELPFKFDTGYDAPVVDCATATNRFATLDFSEEPALVFIGEFLEFPQLRFENVRRFEGWS